MSLRRRWCLIFSLAVFFSLQNSDLNKLLLKKDLEDIDQSYFDNIYDMPRVSFVEPDKESEFATCQVRNHFCNLTWIRFFTFVEVKILIC